MGDVFKNGGAVGVANSPVTVYTAPASTTSIVTGLTVANTTNAAITATVTLHDTSATQTRTLINAVTIPSNTAFTLVGDRDNIVLETTDYIQVVTNSVAPAADVNLSVWEIS